MSTARPVSHSPDVRTGRIHSDLFTTVAFTARDEYHSSCAMGREDYPERHGEHFTSLTSHLFVQIPTLRRSLFDM